ncbi:hypothetical protein SAMN05443252_101874 [Bacillus sp. OV322]|nr:hypothetical protein SAMN05443252_101874 [Bacillus sp. OV322]
MKLKVVKIVSAFALCLAILGASVAVKPEKASACYPAYKCYT